MNLRSLARFASALLCLGAATHLSAQAKLDLVGSQYSYTATFNVATATSTPLLPTGWFAYAQTGTTYTALTPVSALTATGTGAYFFRTSETGVPATDYALGSFIEKNDSTTSHVFFGVAIQNDTGQSLRNIVLSGTAEQYANGGGNNTTTAQIGSGTAFASVTDWTSLSSLALNTQAGTLSSTLSTEVPAFANWANGSTLWIRWDNVQPGNNGQRRAWAIDDLTITATPVPEPSTYAMMLGLGTLGLVWYRRRSARQ